MSAHLTAINGKPHLHIGHLTIPLTHADAQHLLERMLRIDLWEARDPARAHRDDLRLTHAVIRTRPGRIGASTTTGKESTDLDDLALAEALRRPVTELPQGTLPEGTLPKKARKKPTLSMPARHCKHCGKSFAPRSPVQSWCTPACRYASHAGPRLCQRCRKPLNEPRAMLHPECRKTSQAKPARTCLECGKPGLEPRKYVHTRCKLRREYRQNLARNAEILAELGISPEEAQEAA